MEHKRQPRASPITVRFDDSARDALDRAAAADERPTSTLVRLITLDWLRAHGHLPNAKTSRRPQEAETRHD